MPRADDPTARSIFDLLEEKYSQQSAPPAAGTARRQTVTGEAASRGIDGGSRSLLLASLVAVLATALLTLSLKPDSPSTIADTSLRASPRERPPQAGELGAEIPTDAVATRATLAFATPPAASEPAVPEPAVPEPAVPEPAVPEPAVPEPAVPEPAVPEPAASAPVVPEPAVPEPAVPQPVASEAPAPRPAAPRPAASEPPAIPDPPALVQGPVEEPQLAVSDRSETPAADAPATPAVTAATEVRPPLRLVTPLPTYTPEAWAAGIQGDVLVRARIDKEGTVADVEVLRGLSHGLTEAAVAAVRRWRFRPASIDGEPVSADHHLSIRFTL